MKRSRFTDSQIIDLSPESEPTASEIFPVV